MKKCLWCGIKKPIEEFSKEKKNKSGRAGHCLVCHRKHNKKYEGKYSKCNHGRMRRECKDHADSEYTKHKKRTSKKNAIKFSSLKKHARKHGRTFSITREDFLEITSKPCHYCGGPLPEWHGGLDRKDNSRGYETNNVLPCCTWCNRARNAALTIKEMEDHVGPAIKKVREERSKKK